MRHLLVTSVLIVLSIIAASGCAASADDQAAEDLLPLDALFVDLFGTDDVESYQADATERMNQLVVECMNAAGFEFELSPELPREPTARDLESIDFARTSGFGVVDGFFAWIESNNYLSAVSDPNASYLRTLSLPEAERFLHTLDGEPSDDPTQLREDGGCRSWARSESFGAWDRFDRALPGWELAETRDTHPEWLAARVEWQACMSDRGYSYAEPSSILSDVRNRMNELTLEAYDDGMVPLDVDAEGNFAVDDEARSLLDGLRAYEIDAAVANVECTEPLHDRLLAVEREIQTDFLDRNPTAVEALLAAAAG